MQLFLPTKESCLSVGSTHEVVQEDQVEVELGRTQGVLTTITIRREEDAL